MQENQAGKIELEKQLLKYAEDLAKLNHALKKEREHSLKSKRTALKTPDKSGNKKQIFIIHLMVTIVVSYLTIFGPSTDRWLIYSQIFIAIYLSSNLVMLYVPNRYFIERAIFYYLIFFHSIMICIGMYLSGNAGTEFFLIYFLIIGLASMSTSLNYLMINTTVFAAVYGYILYNKGLLGTEMGISYSLRLPFMIITALFFGYIVDVLMKDKARDLKESEEKYRSLVESTNDSVYMMDKDCQYLSANSKALLEYGLPENQIVGKKFSDFHPPEEADEFARNIKKVFETGKTIQYEVDNEERGKWGIHTLSPIEAADTDKVKAVSVVSMDISERVKAGKELKKTYGKLIETQNQLIQNEKMAALGRLASGLAHQIRNPLEIIIMGVEFLGNTMNNQDLHHEKSIQKIKQAVNRTNQIITDFLRFSRKSEMKFESVDVCQLLDESVRLNEHRIHLGNVKIERNYPQLPVQVKADRNLLEQVFMNLLNNGIDAMANGGEIRIKVGTNIVVHIDDKPGYGTNDYFKVGEEMAVVEIEDTGMGIPEDQLPNVFEPFFTTKEAEKGTGLGLSLAHLIVDRHRGNINVQSEVDKGTKFTLNLQPADK